MEWWFSKICQTYLLGLKKGRLNRIATADFKVPSVDDMAYLYTRLVNKIGGYTPQSFLKVMSSPVTEHIDDYNGSLYYENEDYIVDCIKEGKIIIL